MAKVMESGKVKNTENIIDVNKKLKLTALIRISLNSVSWPHD